MTKKGYHYNDDNDDHNNNKKNKRSNNNNKDDPNDNHQNQSDQSTNSTASPSSHPSSVDENKKRVSTTSYYKFSTILAIIITIPGIIILFVLRYYDADILYQIIFSSLAFFICIGLSFKISSKLTKFYKNY